MTKAIGSHVRVGWNRYRQYFWSLAAFQFCALSFSALPVLVTKTFRASHPWSAAIELAGLVLVAPFQTGMLVACRKTVRGYDPYREQLYIFDQRTLKVLWTSVITWILAEVWFFAGNWSSWFGMDHPTMGQRTGEGMLSVVLFIPVVYLWTRLSPAIFMAAKGDSKPLGHAWRASNGHVGDIIKLQLIGALPAGVLLIPLILLMMVGLHKFSPHSLSMEAAWLVFLVTGTLAGGFAYVAMSSFTMDLEKKAHRR